MVNVKLRAKIAEEYATESDFAQKIGWTKQKVSKTILGTRSPKISDINELSKALHVSVGEIVSFFAQ